MKRNAKEKASENKTEAFKIFYFYIVHGNRRNLSIRYPSPLQF